MSDNVLIAIIGAMAIVLAAGITAIVAIIGGKINRVHQQVESVSIRIDGRMDELLKTTKELANAAGNKEGRAEQTEENKSK